MLPNYHRMWEVVEEHRFTAELSALIPNAIRADEFLEGAVWALARKPTLGTNAAGNVWHLPMFGTDLAIYYTFDDTKVYMHSIQAAPKD